MLKLFIPEIVAATTETLKNKLETMNHNFRFFYFFDLFVLVGQFILRNVFNLKCLSHFSFD